ncbi:MAG: phosphoribosyltransferase [Acidiferrobacterales bacterium]
MARFPENVTEDAFLHNRGHVFHDRFEAANHLASLMTEFRGTNAVVAGIPAGGIPLAVTLAKALHLPLAVLVVSKITLPWNTEAGYGAVAADGTWLLNDKMVQQARLDQATIDSGLSDTKDKVHRREIQFNKILPPVELEGKAILIVDDGLASGFTMRVAIDSARQSKAGRIVVAVPTGHATSVIDIAGYCDHLYCANVREGFRFAVADAYEVWTDVDETDALNLIQSFVEENAA